MSATCEGQTQSTGAHQGRFHRARDAGYRLESLAAHMPARGHVLTRPRCTRTHTHTSTAQLLQHVGALKQQGLVQGVGLDAAHVVRLHHLHVSCTERMHVAGAGESARAAGHHPMLFPQRTFVLLIELARACAGEHATSPLSMLHASWRSGAPSPAGGRNKQALCGRNKQALCGRNKQALCGRNKQALCGRAPRACACEQMHTHT